MGTLDVYLYRYCVYLIEINQRSHLFDELFLSNVCMNKARPHHHPHLYQMECVYNPIPKDIQYVVDWLFMFLKAIFCIAGSSISTALFLFGTNSHCFSRKKLWN